MGNFLANEQQVQLQNNAQAQCDFELLCNGSSTQIERRPAFERLRSLYAPVTTSHKSYCNEVTKVFETKFTLWEDVRKFKTSVELANAIRGCIYGGALGDSVGLATEFLTKNVAIDFYGLEYDFHPGCRVYADAHRMGFPNGDWTDDTDQLLLILMSLLETGGQANAKHFASKLVEWKDHGFQGLGDCSGGGLGQSTKRVLCHSSFLVEPERAAQEVWEAGGKKVAPNGAVMRTAVTGIPYFWDTAIVQQNTLMMCRVTHADPRCVASCLIVSGLIAKALQFLADDTHNSIFCVSIEDWISEIVVKAESVLDTDAQNCRLCDLQLDEPHSIGYTYKCLACALVALRELYRCTNSGNLTSTEVFQQIVSDVTMQCGDADTNAAVSGSLLGCFIGYDCLPKQWISSMPYVVWLEAWVQKLLYMMKCID